MKKFILTAALAAVTFFANAQDNMNSKNGTPILPEAGDWSIGFDAAPWLHYAGNLFSNAGNNSPNANYIYPQTIVGKYMSSSTMAYRGMLRIGYNHNSQDELVPDFNNPNNSVTNTTAANMMNINLGAGMQWYRGKGRLRGYYGVMALITFATNDSTKSYGNSPAHGGTGWTEIKQGSTFGIGANAFVGAEYFFAPKMSIGAEYTWGLMLNTTGQGAITSVDASGASSTANTGGNSNFNLDVHNWGGAIMLSLYF